ncbi:MAG TPA: SpvB/TcaC N-terminal domain-containing protein, partial [Spirochaetota bacterium]|nr:SpvB/TcaC N-terminal domain-containing protein [Spirochaetota bacterium]
MTGDEDSSEGNDAFSSSTNHSSKENILQPKLDSLAGSAFVRPPQINNYGTVALNYPMDTLPGRAGMQPSVGLSYSSSGGDGLAGIGWSLSTGLGVISRSTSYGELYYDYRDTFTYNGKRLVKVSGPASSENGTYRLEIESGFSRFELSSAESGGVWKVYDKSGAVTLYGETADSRIYRPDDSSRTYIWNFNRSTDLNGNYMTALYDSSQYRENNILYLKEIRYTGNSRTGDAANLYVRFTYKNRTDAYVSKAPGFTMKMDRLLDEVEVGWDNPGGVFSDTLWSYTMVYGISEDSHRPILTTVKSSRTTTEPKFVYQKANHYLVWQSVDNPRANDPEGNPDDIQYFEGDFNGDGLSDMVFFNPDTGDWTAAEAAPGGGYLHKTYGNRFRGYKGTDRIQWFKGGVTGDYNGDGRSDIAFYTPVTKEFWVAQHNGRTFDFKNYGRLTINIDLFKCEWFSGDFDGNGLSDAVLFDEPSGQWIFMRNRGGYFDFVTLSKQFKNIFRSDFNPDSGNNSAATSDTSDFGQHRDKVQFFSGDFNGDGRTDISIYDARTGRWWVGENYRIDYNPGFQFQWILYKEFSAPEQTLFANDRFSGDFNGDGISDFLLFDRSSGEWWIGETGDRNIIFRVFSRAPEFKDVTRWLQGDFNGDGRTDIGFYSKTDNNIWVGEATPDGFRYRIYTNLATCPNSTRILDAPLPRDEVTIMDARTVVSNAVSTTPIFYQFDGNYHHDSGEQVFAGYFSGGSTPEMLIYKRAENSLYLKQGTGEPALKLNNIDLSADGVRVLGEGKAVRYRANDGIAWYNVEGSVFGGKTHSFTIAYGTGTGIVRETMASFSDGTGDTDIFNFDMASSRYWIDRFTGTANSYVLVLDDQAETPAFVRYNGASATRLSIAGGSLSSDYFKNLRRQNNVKIISGLFTSSDQAQLLLIDYSTTVHQWYLGTISGSAISFTRLTGTPRYYADGFLGYHVNPGTGSSQLVYTTMPADRVAFHLLNVQPNSVTVVRDYVMDTGVVFKGDFDNTGNPVVYIDNVAKRVILNTSGFQLETIGAEFRMDRPDLLTKVYPFRWLQGDYNGDGKTDIGFFHLKERQWYFALTQGTIPDLLTRVDNGIGGSYSFEYVNSSSFDNTDEDGIPRLPMNYRVCSSLLISDGLGRSVETRYRYAHGYAFSGFINDRKETDYFGFGEFTVMDAYGNRNVSLYHNAPFDDFRKNRALAGAIKESHHYGNDNVEYDSAGYSYMLYQIAESGAQSPSFLVVPSKIEQFSRGKLTQTRTSAVELADNKYEMKSKTETVIDHYDDGVHHPETLSTYSEFDNIADTNEMRLVKKVSLEGTAHETTAFYDYDLRGNMTHSRVRYTGSGLPAAADRTRTYEYDGYGNRTRESDTSGSPSRVTEKRFDALLHQFVIEESAIGDSITLTTGYEINYGSAFGSISKKTDPNGNSVYFDYDAYGRLSRERADVESGVATMTEYEYSTEFPLSGKTVQHTDVAPLTPGGGIIETRVYSDGMGRVLHMVRSATGEPGKRYVKSGIVVYDKAGRVIRSLQPYFTGDDEIDNFNSTFIEKNPTVTEYDPSGRVARVTYPQGYDGEPETSVSYTYNDPWEVVEFHSAGRSKRTVRNSRGQVLYVEDSGTGDDGASASAKIGFAYDIAGNRVKKMDLSTPPSPGGGAGGMNIDVPGNLFAPGVKDTSGSNIAVWRYNAFGQMTDMSDPDLGYAHMEYNAFGDNTSRTDALNRTTSFAYDRLGRMTAKYLPGNEGMVRYAYDAKQGSGNALGRIVYIDDPTETKQFSYDRLGRVKEETRIVKTSPPDPLSPGERGSYITRFTYDLVGRKTAIRYPADPANGNYVTVSYEHCPMGVTAVTVNN